MQRRISWQKVKERGAHLQLEIEVFEEAKAEAKKKASSTAREQNRLKRFDKKLMLKEEHLIKEKANFLDHIW